MLEKDDHHELSPPASQESNIAPLVPTYVVNLYLPLLILVFCCISIESASGLYAKTSFSHVIVKLLAFTFAMVVLPIGSYFMTVDTIFGGKSILFTQLFFNLSLPQKNLLFEGRPQISRWILKYLNNVPLTHHRKRILCRRLRSTHGQRRLNRICYRRHERGG